MKKNKGLLIAGLAVVLICGAFYLYSKNKKAINPQAPTKTAEELLKERADHAVTELNSPLGVLLQGKKFDELAIGLQKEKNPPRVLANLIRALFIQNKIDQFSLDEVDHLIRLSIETIQKSPNADPGSLLLLQNQIIRLPLLPKNYASSSLLEHEAKSQEYALLKLLEQGQPPNSEIVHHFQKMLSGKTFSNLQWLNTVEQVRHNDTRSGLIQYASKNIKSFSQTEQNHLLSIASHESMKSPVLLNLAKARLTAKTVDSPANDSAIRYLLSLKNAKLLSSQELKPYLKWVNAVPLDNRSPYFDAASKELEAQ